MAATRKTLSTQLLAAQQDIGVVAKDATNTHQRYDYTSAESMIQHCREALHKHGVVLTAGTVELLPFSATQHGDAVIVNHGFRLTYGDELVELVRAWPAIPGKGRPLDKAVASAQTACLAYTLRDLLLIPRGDEEGVGMDHSARDASAQPASKPKAKRTRTADAKPAASNGTTFERGDVVYETGENPQHQQGRRGDVFWVKGDRIGVRWGPGKEDKSWGNMHEFTADAPQGAAATPAAAMQDGPPPFDDADIPF